MPKPARKVLVFEDNPDIRSLLKFFLRKRGYEFHIAADAVDAVPLTKEHKPDIILMDIIMPGKDGIEACGELRQAGIVAPIVMLTSKDYAEDKDSALKAGANAYVLKPFNTAELEAVIRPLLK